MAISSDMMEITTNNSISVNAIFFRDCILYIITSLVSEKNGKKRKITFF